MPGYGVGSSEPIPELSEETTPCLRGPCRHFWTVITDVGAGNPKGTWDALGISAPKQYLHSCLYSPSHEMDLTDEAVFDCTAWDPLTEREVKDLDSRRKAYWKRATVFADDGAASWFRRLLGGKR